MGPFVIVTLLSKADIYKRIDLKVMDLSIGKAIILFRFHGDFDVVKERLKTLQYFNPDLSMYGLFGG